MFNVHILNLFRYSLKKRNQLRTIQLSVQETILHRGQHYYVAVSNIIINLTLSVRRRGALANRLPLQQ